MSHEIIKYFDGRKNNGKLQTDGTESAELRDHIRVWNSAAKDTSTFCPDVDCAWTAVRQKLKAGRTRSLVPFYWAAASLLLLAGAYLIYTLSPATAPGDVWQYQTASGEVKQVTLPDGSLVWLNGGSTISFEQGKERRVSLSGEAFFHVARQNGQAFIVESGDVTTKVLGTEFNVNKSLKGVAVDVISGRVEITALDRSVEAGPLQRVAVLPGSNQLHKSSISDTNFLYWKTGVLEFNDVPLQKLLDQLGRAYRVNVKASPAVNDCRLTVTFDNMPLEEALDVIAVLLNGSVKREGSSYAIAAESCQLLK